MDVHCVIMAGGSGTRFWPKSRKKMPKQLHSLFSDKPMIIETIDRILPLFKENNIHVVAGINIEENVKKTMSCFKSADIVIEPKARNTAPCIAYMAMKLFHQHGDGIMLVLPSDHVIQNRKKFTDVLAFGMKAAEKHNTIVTLGLEPDSPHTGYGYIQLGEQVEKADDATLLHKVKSFKEKPNAEKAKEFFDSKEYMWNSGMFMMKTSTIISAVQKYMPELHKGLEEIAKSFGKSNEKEIFNKLFAELPAQSIDIGVIEKLDNVLTIPTEFGWNDIGSWTSLNEILQAQEFGISDTKNTVCVNSKNLIISEANPKKLIATLGVEDLIIIDTEDALLVTTKDKAQDIKEIVLALEKKKMEQYL